jgi:hypothetical protein
MAALKSVSIIEQNANTIQGVYYDTAVYATSGTGGVGVKWGRDLTPPSGAYVILGTQTSSNHFVVLDQSNATHGASVVIKRNCTAPGTSIVTVVTGSFAGSTVGIIASSVNGLIETQFDGIAGVWR